MILVLVSAVFIVLGVLSLRPTRWAYWTFVIGGILFFRRPSDFTFIRALATVR